MLIGLSLTEETLIVRLELTVSDPSVKTTAIVSGPFASGLGVKVHPSSGFPVRTPLSPI